VTNTGMRKAFPVFVRQVTNTGMRRPGYEDYSRSAYALGMRL